MNNFYLAFSVVFPLFCMMALGYFLRAIKIFNDDFLKQLNNVCFKVFLPMVLFANIYKSDFKTMFSVKLIAFALSSIALAFIILMVIVPFFEKNNLNRGVIVQGVFRSNFILFGIPIAASLYGNNNTSVTAILLAFVIPLFNLLSIISFEIFLGKKFNALTIIKEVCKNPLIIGSALAFVFVIAKLKMPDIVEQTVFDIAGVTTPLALIILGGSFKFKSIAKYLKPLIFSVLGKIVIMPLVFIPISICLGFRNLELAALLGMFASPTAVSTFTMAQSVEANEELAGQIVVIDSILSVITIFIWITILKYLHVI